MSPKTCFTKKNGFNRYAFHGKFQFFIAGIPLLFQIQQEQSKNKDTNGSCNRSNVKEILQILARNTRVSNDYTDVQFEKTRKIYSDLFICQKYFKLSNSF